MRSLFTKVITGTVALGLAGTLVSCGGNQASGELASDSWDEVVAAAKEEGKVNFYTGMAEIQNTRLVKAFNAQYPEIVVNVQRGAGEMTPRVESEMSSGTPGADVFALADPNWFKQKGEESFLPVSGPATTDWSSDGWAREGLAPVVTATPNAIFVWNTDIFPDGFKDWDDFLAPQVKGKIGLRTDVTKSVAGYLDMMETSLGEGYLRSLGKQAPKVYPSVVPMTQAVASGEVGVTNASLPPTVYELKQNGAPIESFVPNNPGYAMEFGIAPLTNSRNPNAAALFTDFSISEKGQEAVNGDGFGASMGLDDISGALDLSGSTMMDSSKYDAASIDEWNAKLKEYYKQ
jgi:iron(III) transport system substrate-binding protein